MLCNHILGSLQLVFRVGLPPHVCTCSTSASSSTLPTAAISRPLCCSPLNARRKQCSLCLCRCNVKAAVVAVNLWICDRQTNCKCEKWSKWRRIPRAHRWLVGGVLGTLWCVSSFKIRALCLRACGGEGGRMVICCHSHGNVLTVHGLTRQEAGCGFQACKCC